MVLEMFTNILYKCFLLLVYLVSGEEKDKGTVGRKVKEGRRVSVGSDLNTELS